MSSRLRTLQRPAKGAAVATSIAAMLAVLPARATVLTWDIAPGTLGAGGGKIDTAGQTVTLDATSPIAGTSLGKTGSGTLNISSTTQNYAALTTSGGTTNISTPAGTGTSAVTANATTNFSASQTLASLDIAGGVEVTFGGWAVVPKPGALGLLLASAPGLLGRRWRKPR